MGLDMEEITELLPVCHVYYPETFGKVLKTYFSREAVTSFGDDRSKCYVLGRWELRSGKPGKDQEILKRRDSNDHKRNKNLRSVIATTIVGICSEDTKRTQENSLIDDSDENLQIIGVVNVTNVPCATSSLHLERNHQNFKLHFEFCPNANSTGDESLSITAVTWNGQFHYLHVGSRLIVFLYDPIEFQQWNMPTKYPLGVPPVFIDGLSYIQDKIQLGQEKQLPFIPVFPPILQDHQDLNACSSGVEDTNTFSQIYSNNLINFISSRSSGLQQISHKVSLLTGALLRQYQLLPVLNFLLLLALDSLIGYLITSYLISIPNLLGLLHSTVEDMLDRLNHLLRWLRGAPAGLKLNANLNSLYWRFFSYHIHLWANYIGILEPIFAIILHTIQYFGVLGTTIQVSLLKDLLSLATFHVYCLYIYATRLYSLQTSAIKSLCRIFFGRKYNPLRDRIDNVQLTTPELFLSSFGFVILIFLLPTTMVYYAGFVCLRVPVLIMERALEYFVAAVNKLPVVSWVLKYLKSPRVADEIYLTLTSSNPTQFGNNFITFRLCLRSTRTLFTPPDFGRGIKSIVRAVMDGTVLKD